MEKVSLFVLAQLEDMTSCLRASTATASSQANAATARSPRPTAVFTANDLQALGVYQAARTLGRRIPDDLSVVGFDDLPIARLVDPPLTTVHQPLVEMAMAATELALALGRGEQTTQPRIEMATTLTVRKSTAPPSPPGATTRRTTAAPSMAT